MPSSTVNSTRTNSVSRSAPIQPNDSALTLKEENATIKKIRGRVDTFLESMSDVLNDITALEVNTMVVSEISGHKFNPEDAYEQLYKIPTREDDPYFENQGIAQEKRDRYVKLRKKLQDAYDEYLYSLPEGERFAELPNPEDELDKRRLPKLLQNNQFLRNLRKLRELRHLIESEEFSSNNVVDIIYAQTIIQIDGDIINRFDQRLFADQNKDFLLQVHQEGVTSGEAQWRGLLKFMVDLMEKILQQRKTDSISP